METFEADDEGVVESWIHLVAVSNHLQLQNLSPQNLQKFTKLTFPNLQFADVGRWSIDRCPTQPNGNISQVRQYEQNEREQLGREKIA